MPELGVEQCALHLIGFLILGSALLVVLSAYGVRGWLRMGLAACALTIYAAVDESTQPLFNRYAAMEDWFADIAGAGVAIVVWELLAALVRYRQRVVQTQRGAP